MHVYPRTTKCRPTAPTALALIPVHDLSLGDADHRQQGFLAQELYKYYPDAVVVGGDNVFLDPWLVDYGRVTPASCQGHARREPQTRRSGDRAIEQRSTAGL